MNDFETYTLFPKKTCMFIVAFRHNLFLLLFFLFYIPSVCFSQEEPLYDEVTVSLRVQGIGKADIPALIKGEMAYLSISDVFNLIKIKNTPSGRLDSLSGFFINTKDEYLIDRVKKQVVFLGKKIDLKPEDLILTETNLYMKVNLFGEIFGLVCAFKFRDLSVTLTTQLELPLIREMKMEQMRNNLKRLKGEVKTDTTIGRNYPLFKFGIADWSIASLQQQGASPSTLLNLALGSVVAGGEMNIGLNYNQLGPFDSRQQTYLWRYANNDFNVLRQVLIGKMMPQSMSLLNGSLIGVQLTNTPTIYRRSFGTYTMTNVTEPEWIVELYINNVLVDYVKADASGFYKFEVPLVYGNSILKVRMYGPSGEVREKIEDANIPFNFLPSGELEYNINAGVVENKPNTQFYRTNVNYGVSRKMSIGGGYEYFSSPSVLNSLPFIGSSIMLLNDLLISSEYTFGVYLKSSLSYRLRSNIQMDMNYTGYEKGQRSIPNAPLQLSGVSISIPIQRKHFFSYTRLSLDQMIYSNYKMTNASFLFSGNFNGISSNITTSTQYLDPKHINTTSNLALSYRFPKQINLMSSVQYDYNQQKLIMMRWNLQKPFLKNGYLNISYQHNFNERIGNLEFGFRYDFSFMQTELLSILKKNSNSFSQSARGSLFFDRKNNYMVASKNSLLGNGGFTFLAFLDINGNGRRDKNEPKVSGLNLRVNGGRIVKSERDSTIRVIDLPPYTSYLVELDKNSFKSISWQIKKLNLNVYADPNQFKLIEIPVEVVAEASGTVNLKTKKGSRGLGRVYVCFYRNGQTLAGRILTEDDGYFSYLGLTSGNYTARMDSSQLAKIKMTATPEFKAFTVKPSKEGEFIEGLDFTLQSTVKDSTEEVIPKSKLYKGTPSTGKAANIINYALNVDKHSQDAKTQQEGDRIKNLASKRTSISLPLSGKSDIAADQTFNRDDHYTITSKQGFSIQMGSYIFDANALAAERKITDATGLPIVFVEEDGFIKLWIDGFATRRDAEQCIKQMSKMGLHPSYIIRDNSDIQILANE